MFAIRLPRVFLQPKAFRHARPVLVATFLLAWCGGTFAPTAAANAVPYVDVVSPVSVPPGATNITLTVLGTGFINGSTVKWNSTALATTFVSAQKLTAAVPDSLVAAQGLGTITVFTPTPLGGTSNVFYVPVAASEASTVFPSTPSSSVTVGSVPQGIATADLNGDGKLDLIVANRTSGTVTVLLGNGDGTFTTKSTPAAGAGANWIAVGDFNEDGIPDLAVADVNSTGAAGVTILLGVGDGTFTAGATLTTGSGPFSVTTADFNGDGHLDLAVANQNDLSVSVFQGNGDGTFSAATSLTAGETPQQIVAGDFNEDGNLDLAVTNESADTVSVFFGTGTGAFGAQHVFSTGGSAFPIGLIAADFNGDGHLDLAAVNASDVAILTNNGAGVFTLTSNPGTGSNDLIAGVVGDYNGDGHLDIVLSDRAGGEAFLLLGNGSGSFGGAVTFTTASGAFGVATADFNGDGALDLAIANGAAGNVSIFLQTLPVSLSPSALAFGSQSVGVASSPAQTVTFTNHSGAAVTISSIAFTGTDNGDFSSGGTCSTSTPVANNTSCTITVTFTPGVAGARQATLTVTDSADNSPQTLALTGTGTILVPTISKAFGAASIPLNGTTSLSFTISNPAGNQSITGVGFTDALPAGLLVATPNGLSGTCGAGTVTATAGADSINLSGGTLAAGASTCTFQANVVGTTAGAQANTTGVISSTETGAGATSNTATVRVIGPAVISKAFGAASIPLNGTTSLTFSLSNPNATTSLSGVGFGDTLPAGLAIATPNGLTNSCGGAPTATAGTNSVTLSAAALAGSGSCTLVANVTGTAAGTKNNITGAVQSTEGGTGGTASASLTVEAPPTIAKAFGAAAIALNGTTSLTFTITNPSANTAALAGVAFTDTLPSGIVVATPNGLSNSCGGTPVATAGSAIVALSGTTVATNTSCTLSVNITGTGSAGAVTNTTGNVTSTNGGTGNTATANLGIGPGPVITSANNAAFVVGTAGSFTITASGSPTPSITETGALPAGVTFLDNGNGTATLSGTPAASGTPGTYTVTLTAHNGNGADAVQTFTLTIGKGTPAITWVAPSNITFGTALTATQLDATSGVPGTFVYTPPLGTVLGAGPQTLSYTFTPTDTADFNARTGSVVLTVEKATPAITWAAPAAIGYGTPLGASQLDATSTVAGTFTYTPPAGTIENAGSQTLSVTFTPTDTTDNLASTAQVTLTVNTASTSVTLSASPTPANPGATVTFTVMATSAGGVPPGSVTFFDNGVMLATAPLTGGTATYSTSGLAVGAHTITATYTANGNFAAGASAAFTETIGAGGFTIVPAATVAVVQAGQAANIPITVLALGGIAGQVEFSVAGLPTGATVSFIPNPLSLSANPSVETLITMTQPRFNYLAEQTSPISPSRAIFTGALCIPIFGMVFGGARFAWRRNRRGSLWLVLLILFSASGMIAGCANRSGFQDTGTPAGSYPLTITAVATTSSGTITDTTTVLLTVR